MGSIIDDIECPNCAHDAYSDFYYKTGEEYLNCNNCGYHRSATIVNRNKKLSELTEDDWENKELKNPYGAYKIKYYDELGYVCGSLETEDEYEQLLRYINDNTNVEFSSFSRFIDDKIKVDILVDNGPKVDSAGFTDEHK